MTKLLYITNGITGAGGLERVLSIKTSYLADVLGYEVHILMLNFDKDKLFYDFSDKIILHDIKVGGNPVNYILQYITGIRNVFADVKPDITLVCDDGLKAFFVPKILGLKTPIIYERHVSKEIEMHHDFLFWKKRLIKLKWKLMEQLAPSFSKFVVLTNGNKNEWKQLKNMIVIPNPLSFYPDQSSTLVNKKVIAVGKHGFQKSYDRLLAAWQLVIQSNPDWQLEIYGTINPVYQLKELAQSLKISDNVSFFAPEKNIESKYLEASVYVMSSRFEGFGMVLIEAMACGVPCVSFDCNYGPSDIIMNNEDGFLVKNGDIEGLSKALNKLITNDVLRTTLGAKAKQNVKRFAPESVVKQWDNLFKELAS
jgi:glycosyltransferase involved in cell wall biosynthesis